MRTLPVVAAVLVLGTMAASANAAPNEDSVERGKYLSKIGGCNDCHTAGYLMSNGEVPEANWLLGDTFGWRGPWGTTYAPNLRLSLQKMTEDQWVAYARALRTRPPMPWFTLNEMHEEDLRAIYQYIRQMGPVGKPAPAFVPPDQEPKPPFATFPAPPPEAGASKGN